MKAWANFWISCKSASKSQRSQLETILPQSCVFWGHFVLSIKHCPWIPKISVASLPRNHKVRKLRCLSFGKVAENIRVILPWPDGDGDQTYGCITGLSWNLFNSNSKLANPVGTSGSPILEHQDHRWFCWQCQHAAMSYTVKDSKVRLHNAIHLATSKRTSLEEGISLADGVTMTQGMILQAKLSGRKKACLPKLA